MRKNKYLISAIIGLSVLATACPKSEPSATVVEYTQACDKVYEGQTIAVHGFLNAAATTPCLKTMKLGKDKTLIRECAFKFLDKVNVVGNEMMVYVAEGKENSQVETPEAGTTNVKPSSVFSRDKLKLHLDDGTEIVPQEDIATPVTVTGEIRLTDKGDGAGGVICALSASKVEKR